MASIDFTFTEIAQTLSTGVKLPEYIKNISATQFGLQIKAGIGVFASKANLLVLDFNAGILRLKVDLPTILTPFRGQLQSWINNTSVGKHLTWNDNDACLSVNALLKENNIPIQVIDVTILADRIKADINFAPLKPVSADTPDYL